MLDIVDVFVWYPDTKARCLHSFVVHAVIHSLDTEQDAHNYLNTKTFANNINLRSLWPVNEARDTSTSDTLPSSSFIILMSSLQYLKPLITWDRTALCSIWDVHCKVWRLTPYLDFGLTRPPLLKLTKYRDQTCLVRPPLLQLTKYWGQTCSARPPLSLSFIVKTVLTLNDATVPQALDDATDMIACPN
jgi:hypothetical protein